jgi:hypothetical protein
LCLQACGCRALPLCEDRFRRLQYHWIDSHHGRWISIRKLHQTNIGAWPKRDDCASVDISLNKAAATRKDGQLDPCECRPITDLRANGTVLGTVIDSDQRTQSQRDRGRSGCRTSRAVVLSESCRTRLASLDSGWKRLGGRQNKVLTLHSACHGGLQRRAFVSPRNFARRSAGRLTVRTAYIRLTSRVRRAWIAGLYRSITSLPRCCNALRDCRRGRVRNLLATFAL